MFQRSHRLGRGSLVHNTLWVTGGNGVGLIIQAIYFVILTRSLGPGRFGAFVSVVAFISILSPFVGLGSCNLLIRNVAQNRAPFAVCWGNGLASTIGCGVIAVMFVLACSFVLPASIPKIVLLLLGFANLIFQRITDLCGFAFVAVGRFDTSAPVNVSVHIARLVGLVVLVRFTAHPTVQQWSAVYFAASALASTSTLLWSLKTLGRPALRLQMLSADLLDGFYFSSGLAAQSIYNDIDKTMLARLSELSAAGIYGAAYRIIDVTLVPLRSVLVAAYPQFFRSGKRGLTGSLRYMKQLLPAALCYSLLIAATLLLGASFVPHVLGSQYAQTEEALRWLAVLPLIKAIHFFLADALTGAGHQGLRTFIQGLVAAFNILINLWVIPLWSWRGAAWSSIASDALLAVLLLATIRILIRKSRPTTILIEEAA